MLLGAVVRHDRLGEARAEHARLMSPFSGQPYASFAAEAKDMLAYLTSLTEVRGCVAGLRGVGCSIVLLRCLREQGSLFGYSSAACCRAIASSAASQ